MLTSKEKTGLISTGLCFTRLVTLLIKIINFVMGIISNKVTLTINGMIIWPLHVPVIF
jgi:hypothetical protein